MDVDTEKYVASGIIPDSIFALRVTCGIVVFAFTDIEVDAVYPAVSVAVTVMVFSPSVNGT